MVEKVKSMSEAVAEDPKVKTEIDKLGKILEESKGEESAMSETALAVLVEYLRELKNLQVRSNQIAKQIHSLLVSK